jgi:flagellar hook-associated protein 1 FlgK
MPISTFLGIQTALRGILAQQRALDTTSHNVANAQTPGYTRQEAVLSASQPLTLPAGGIANGSAARLGTGVDVQQYRRLRDAFLDLQYRGQAMELSEQQTRSAALDQVESALAEPGANGLSAELGRFWSAWEDFANAPSNPAAAQALVERARNLAGTINDLQRRMDTVRRQAGDELTALTAAGGDVDATARDLAATFNAIRDAEKTGAQPNDLYDRRDLLLDHLATLGQVSVTPSPGGSFDVTLGGVTIVDSDDATGTAAVPAGAFPMALGASPGGRLGALQTLASASGPLAGYQDQLAQVAATLATSVNAVYSATGTTFFTFGTGGGGLPELSLSPGIDGTTVRAGVGSAGANDIALAIGALRGGDADSRYARLVTQIGSDVADAERREATARILADNLDDRRQSVAGVSLDEEMTNLIRFQRGYQASARAMSTVDEMLDTLINRTGRVGL